MPRMLSLIALLLWMLAQSPGDAQVGGTVVLVEHAEAGEVFDPDDGTVVRFPTALSPTHVLYEERNFFGQALGVNGLDGVLFKVGTVGNGSRDLAYCISTATTPENRREWERDLLAYYIEEFAASAPLRIASSRCSESLPA